LRPLEKAGGGGTLLGFEGVAALGEGAAPLGEGDSTWRRGRQQCGGDGKGKERRNLRKRRKKMVNLKIRVSLALIPRREIEKKLKRSLYMIKESYKIYI